MKIYAYYLKANEVNGQYSSKPVWLKFKVMKYVTLIRVWRFQLCISFYQKAPRFSKNYKRQNDPLYIRLVALWRVLTCRNFILVDFSYNVDPYHPAGHYRPLWRSDYDADIERLVLAQAYQHHGKPEEPKGNCPEIPDSSM